MFIYIYKYICKGSRRFDVEIFIILNNYYYNVTIQKKKNNKINKNIIIQLNIDICLGKKYYFSFMLFY